MLTAISESRPLRDKKNERPFNREMSELRVAAQAVCTCRLLLCPHIQQQALLA